MSFNLISIFQINSQAVILQTFFTIALSYRYDVLYEDDSVYAPCAMPNVKYIDEYLDRSNLTFEFQNDGSVIHRGVAEWLKDTGSEDVPLRMELFKKQRGEWINTIYTVIRPDICVALFASIDVFSPPRNDIKENCPLYKGKKLHFNNSYTLTMDSPDFHFAGKYKIQATAVFKKLNETMCLDIHAEVYRAFG